MTEQHEAAAVRQVQALVHAHAVVQCVMPIAGIQTGNHAEVHSVTDDTVRLYGAGCGRYADVPCATFLQHFTLYDESTSRQQARATQATATTEATVVETTGVEQIVRTTAGLTVRRVRD